MVSWSKTSDWLDKKRNKTGVPLITRQDCFKEVPISDATLDEFEFNATLTSGLISEKLKADFSRNVAQTQTAKGVSIESAFSRSPPKREDMQKRINAYFQGLRQAKVSFQATTPKNKDSNLWATTPLSRQTREIMRELDDLRCQSAATSIKRARNSEV
jgi:hypothetical protein